MCAVFIFQDVNNNTANDVNSVGETNDEQKTAPKPAKAYSCTLCKYSTRSRGNFYRQKQAVHQKKKLKYDKCNKEFSQQYDLNQHKKSVHETLNCFVKYARTVLTHEIRYAVTAWKCIAMNANTNVQIE